MELVTGGGGSRMELVMGWGSRTELVMGWGALRARDSFDPEPRVAKLPLVSLGSARSIAPLASAPTHAPTSAPTGPPIMNPLTAPATEEKGVIELPSPESSDGSVASAAGTETPESLFANRSESSGRGLPPGSTAPESPPPKGRAGVPSMFVNPSGLEYAGL